MINLTYTEEVKKRINFAIPLIIVLGIITIGIAFVILFLQKQEANAASVSGKALTTSYPKPRVDGTTMGDPNAPVVIEEFSDFQCAYCRQFFLETEKPLIDQYVSTGKVYFIHRTLGSWLGPGSQYAAEAAYCAGDQDMFWEYHDALFTNQGRMKFSPVNLIQLADSLVMDLNEFGDCVESYKYREQVKKDLTDGVSAGVRGTPSFLINGRLVVGAQPFSFFQQAIETALNEIDQD
jgi:protein-disulfide isomerase